MMMMMMSGMVLHNKLPITEQPWIVRLRLSMIFGSWQKNVCMIMMAVVFFIRTHFNIGQPLAVELAQGVKNNSCVCLSLAYHTLM
jgi:hypothetical protein